MSNEAQMHQQHKLENVEHAQWLREISRWRVDHQQALAILCRVQATIHQLEADTEAHAAAIREHHMHITHHEAELESRAASANPELHAMYTRAHEEVEAAHADVRKFHELLTARHNQMMENLAALFEALADD